MYGTAEITIFAPNGSVERHYRRCNNYVGIYCLLEPLVGHATAEDAASWCELASIGEVYADEDFEILITE